MSARHTRVRCTAGRRATPPAILAATNYLLRMISVVSSALTNHVITLGMPRKLAKFRVSQGLRFRLFV